MIKYFILCIVFSVNAGVTTASAGNIFHIQNPDYEQSPYTGMTRNNWVEADKYLLEGAFRHIKSLDDPMYFMRLGSVCYPADQSNAGRVRGATLEGMARTLFMASTLIHEDSTIQINGIRLADYYRRQLTLLVDPKSKQHIEHRGNRGPCQDLVEFGALGVSLFICGDVIWDPLPQIVRDSLYTMIESYADGPTVPQNWRFFNVFAMSYFKAKGYPVNENLLLKYVHLLLSDYRGDGWYWDNPNFDYYSMWAYQLYGKLWSRFFGHSHYPELARQFEHNYEEMFSSYPYMFGRDGSMIMWGRSNLYRFASTAPLPWSESGNINQGWMRRIASGCLLQFLQNPDFLYSDSIPTPGWYKQFDPVLQGYSCRGSVYWCAKAFLPLLLKESDSYWNATENEGGWEKMPPNQIVNHWYNAPKILITNYANTGASELRAYCDYDISPKWSEKFRGSEQYNRLAYNSLFPWMADGKNGEVAMAYVFKNTNGQWEPMRRYTTLGYTNGIMTRTVWPQSDSHFIMTLHDKPIPDGMLRDDEVTACSKPTSLRLGHYALPAKHGTIQERTVKLKDCISAYAIFNGDYELVMIPLAGFSRVEFVHTIGLHPDSNQATVLNAVADIKGKKRLRSLLLFKKGRFSILELNKIVTAQMTCPI